MLVTNSHLTWWRSKREPIWVSKIQSKAAPVAPSVHDLINLQVRYPRNPNAKKEDVELMNTLALLRLRRKNSQLTDTDNLDQLRTSPHSSSARKVWCCRMLRKMGKAVARG